MFPSLICRSAPLVKSISMILISPVAAAWCKAVRPRESFKETKVVPPIQTIQASTKFRWFMANKVFFEGGIRARTKGLDTQRKSSSSMKRNLVKIVSTEEPFFWIIFAGARFLVSRLTCWEHADVLFFPTLLTGTWQFSSCNSWPKQPPHLPQSPAAAV